MSLNSHWFQNGQVERSKIERHNIMYRARANKGRTYYSNENFLEIAAANNQERL